MPHQFCGRVCVQILSSFYILYIHASVDDHLGYLCELSGFALKYLNVYDRHNAVGQRQWEWG